MFILVSCQKDNLNYIQDSQDEDNSVSSLIEDPRYIAKTLMRSWQIEKIYLEYGENPKDDELLPISVTQAESYISQKDILYTTDYYEVHWGLELKKEENKEEKLLMDALHEYISEWMLMRENMKVLYTEQTTEDIFYSIILVAGNDSSPYGQCLVKYMFKDNYVDIIDVEMAQRDLTMYGSYIGIGNDKIPICFGLIKQTQFNTETTERIESQISYFEIKFSNGDVYLGDIPIKPYFFIENIPENEAIIDIVFYDEGGNILEELSDALEYLYTDSYNGQ